MSLTLSAGDVTRLQSVLTKLLSPLESTTLDGWGVAAIRPAQSNLGANRAIIDIPNGTAAASDSGAAAALNEFGEHRAELLQLLLPAFKAGVNTQRRLAQHCAGLLRLLDTLDSGLHIFDDQARPLHQNEALVALLAGEPEAQRIRAQILLIALAVSSVLRGRAAISLAPPEPLCREVRTGAATYQLRGTVFGQTLLGPEVTIAVSVERVMPEPIADTALMERYRLTPREVQVARRLGQGDSSAEIARSLGISRYTARHHAENVMRKLDVRSRGAVAARLMTS